MKNLLFILFAAVLLTGCVARKIVTVPAGIAVKTAAKTTGKVAVGTTKAILPNRPASK